MLFLPPDSLDPNPIEQASAKLRHTAGHALTPGFAMPELQDMFVALHRRRTKGEPRIPVGRGGPKELGRKDNYVSSYAGREYFKTEEPFEVMTMGIQQIFYPVWGWEYLDMMLRDDPEMLDLLLGLLFGYDP